MARLDVYPVEAAASREFRSLHVAVLQPVQIVVRNQRIVRGNVHGLVQQAIVVGDDRRRLVHRPRVAAGVG